MRITIVQGAFLPVPPLLGGAVEKVWFNLGKEFAQRGHEVTHVSRSLKDLPTNEVIEGVRHRRVSGFPSPATTPRRMMLDFWYALRAMSQLPPADILVTNTFWLPALEFRRSRGRAYVHVARYPKGQLKLYRGAILQTVSEPIRNAILAEYPRAVNRVRVIAYPLSDRYLRPEVGVAGNSTPDAFTQKKGCICSSALSPNSPPVTGLAGNCRSSGQAKSPTAAAVRPIKPNCVRQPLVWRAAWNSSDAFSTKSA
jgi:hypothetical protein